MIYNKIDTSLLSSGTPKKFSDDEDNKLITPLFYDNSQLDFSLKNKYVKIEEIEKNNYDKEFVTIKSKEYSDVIDSISKKLNVQSPVQSDGSFRATINFKTKFNESIDKIRKKKFNACISLSFPYTYSDENKKTLPVQLKDLIVIDIINEDLEVDFEKLQMAM